MIFEEIAKKANLNENERQLLRYMMDHIEELPFLSSRELARRNYMSSTAVLRCIKKMGFENYNDFKLNIHSYLKNYNGKETKVSENDELLELMNKMTKLNEQIIEKTKEQIPVDLLNKVIEKIDQYKFIDIIANNENADIAEYFSCNLCRVGKIATVYEDDNKQLLLGLNATKDHLVIVITKYGENVNVLRAMKALKKHKVCMISITSLENQTLEQLSNYTLRCVADESTITFVNLVFIMSLKYVLDLIYASLFSKNYKDAINHENTFFKMFDRK